MAAADEPADPGGLFAYPDVDGRFADNIVFFGRALRKAGFKIGPGTVADAIEAAALIGVGSRREFHAALRSIFVKRREDQALFDDAFALFWCSHGLIGGMIAMMPAETAANRENALRDAGQTRMDDSLIADRETTGRGRGGPDNGSGAQSSSSGGDGLRHTDFAQMSATEMAAARKALSALVLPMDEVITRRFRSSRMKRSVDPRATMRDAMKTGGDLILPRYRERKTIQPPLVVLADISGSMSQYTRIFLHFLHVLTAKRRRVHTFLFGTQLSNVTRQMQNRDPDRAMNACINAVNDWSGGTRIGATLHAFNRLWSRRVLGQGAVVLLITDGLERDGIVALEKEMDRLHRSCRRLIWLNPLLRFDGFEARARGVRAMLPHVDEFRAIHNLQAVSDLAAALSGRPSNKAGPRRFMAQR